MSKTKRAYVIGIDNYGNNIPTLRSAVNDATAIAQVLTEKHGYKAELFLNEKARLADLRALFAGLPEIVGKEDRLLLYFAGHGIAEDSPDSSRPVGYFFPQDASKDNEQSLLPMAEVHAALHKLRDHDKCKHLIVLLDCCFAGAFKWSNTRLVQGRKPKLYKELYERYLSEPARQVITSAAYNETALDVVAGQALGGREDGKEHSPFATALLKALNSSVADIGFDGKKGDGVVTATKLFLYIEKNLAAVEKSTESRQQRPGLWQLDDRSEGEFLFEVPDGQLNLRSAVELSKENNPYCGLNPFEEKDAARFFGREELTEKLVRAVRNQRLTVVVGAAGSGKSSLVKAGLLHQLGREKSLAILPLLRPGTAPLQALKGAAQALYAMACIDGNSAAVPDERLTLAKAAEALKQHKPGVGGLLIVDQLEELVTLADATELPRFLTELNAALAAGMRVVLTLRSDFEGYFTTFIDQYSKARFLMTPMRTSELRQAIERPANSCDLEFDPPDLVDELVDEVIENRGSLPLLWFTLSELYLAKLKRADKQRTLTRTDYQKLGKMTGALGMRGDEIFASLPDAATQATMERVLLRMMTWFEYEKLSRRQIADSELESDDPAENARIQQVVQRLTEAHLMIHEKNYFAAAHDTLVTKWKKVEDLVAKRRDELKSLQGCTMATAEWSKAGKATHKLWDYHLEELQRLHDLKKAKPLLFSKQESFFIELSVKWHRNRRIKLIAVALSVVSVLFMILFAAIFS